MAKLSFRGQRVFLHNASGWFGDAPVEASGDFGLNPEDGEFHLMCQVLKMFCCVYRLCHTISKQKWSSHFDNSDSLIRFHLSKLMHL